MMTGQKSRPTNVAGWISLLLVSILALGSVGCTTSGNRPSLSEHNSPKASPTAEDQSPGKILEDPALTEAFNNLLIARSQMAIAGSTLTAALPTPATTITTETQNAGQNDRMSHKELLEVVDYPSLDTIPGEGGWSTPSNQFDGRYPVNHNTALR